jgi:hypothetical protein
MTKDSGRSEDEMVDSMVTIEKGLAMSRHTPMPDNELEEGAQGHQLFRAPGNELQLEQAREQAEASGWLPPDVIYEWPSPQTHRQIVDRRQDLYDALRRLELSVARATGQEDWLDTVDGALSNLEIALERHVREIEAPDGLFDEVIERAPHLASDVQRLRDEHDDLLIACRAVRELDEEVPTAEVRRKVLGLLGRLAIHRQRGAELLFDTYNVDLAAAN